MAWLLTLAMLLTVFSPLSALAFSNSGEYTLPVDSYIKYGIHDYSGHTGADFKASIGTTVVASKAGTVVTALDRGCRGSHRPGNSYGCSLGDNCPAYKAKPGSYGSYANYIVIDHGNGVQTYYCHLKTGSFKVSVGDHVEQGTILAESGAAGNTTGPHLHFEVRDGGTIVDPEDYLTNTYVEKDGANTPANNLPVLFVDTAEASGKGQLHVGGWAYDPDDTGRSVEIRISVNGEVHTVTADKERSDVDNIHHCGRYHGFDTVFYTEQSGNVTVEVTAVDANDSSQSTGPETRTVTVQQNRSPILNVDDVRAEEGRIRVAGWAYDPDDLNKAVSVHVYIGGEGHAILANNSRTDLDDIHHCGPNHGFAAYITTDKLGAQDVVLFAIDTEDSGRNTGSRVYSVNIAQDTTGPTISNLKVTNIDATGYTVTCTVTDANGVDRVQFPTWATSASDLPAGWETSSKYAGTKNGNTYTYRVKVSDFNNASGPYSTHVYAFDHFGNISMAGQNKILTLPTGIVINTSAPTIYGLNNTVKLTATISPSSATLKTVSWSSSDPKVATVSSDGTVKSVGYGTATIYAKTANGKTAAAKVTVAQTSQVTLSSIAVATMPNKTYYYAGEPLNTAGLTLKATYSDGSTKTITEGFTCSPTKLDTVNHSQPITVSYGGKTTTFTINVNEFFVKSIEIVSAPTKTTYCVGDTLDTTGLKIKAFYNSGSSRVVDTGFVCTPTTLNTAGTQTITVSYKDATTNVPKTATFDVTVQNVTLSGIAIASNPSKTSYFVGDTLDTTGLKLTATYNNGTTQTITSGFTCTPTALSTAGAQTVTVSYGGKTATFTVNVQAVTLSGIAVASKPTKTSYYVGDTLDPTGLKLTATYSNGTSQTITSGFTCTPTVLTSAGVQTVTVNYGGKTATFTVNVELPILPFVTLTFDPTDGVLDLADTPEKTVYPGEAYGRLPEPTADGMVFLGWYTESGKRITSLTTCDLTGDAAVSARWALASAEGWSFDETTGTLTLDGSGAMKEYTSAAEAPWYSYRDSIAHLVVKSGVTSLSSYAFVGCQNLEDIALPDTLQTIGTMTFYGCDSLNNVTIPASVRTIGSYAFADALSLSRITFAGDAPEFGTGVFTFRKLTAYYPVYASGWETVVDGRYDFGGSITWVRSSESLAAEEPVLLSAAEPDDVLALDWTL